MRFGLLPVRSPLLGESRLISFPGLLRWFTSPSVASAPYFVRAFGCTARAVRVTPFGNPGISGRSLLPRAFRGLPRPSSPSGSKASAVDLFSLDHIVPSAPFKLGLSRKAFFLRFLFVFPSLVVSKSARGKSPAPLLEIRGFEPLTSGLQSRCSSQLSYIPFSFGEAPSPGTWKAREKGKKTEVAKAGPAVHRLIAFLSERR